MPFDQVFTKIGEMEDLLIVVVGLEQIKGAKLTALKESVTFLRDIKYIDRSAAYKIDYEPF